MENPPTIESPSGRSRFKFSILLILIWLLIFGAFGIFGWDGPGRSAAQGGGGSFDRHEALEVAICFLSVGAGVATCVVTGISAVNGLRENRIKRSYAISIVLISVIAAPMLTWLLLGIASHIKPLDFLQEEEALLAVAGIVWWTIEAGAVVFVVFAFIIGSFPKRVNPEVFVTRRRRTSDKR